MWCEKRLMDYHGSFDKPVGVMESILPLAFLANKIMEEDVPGYNAAVCGEEKGNVASCFGGNRVDLYIRSSLRNAFTMVGFS